LPNYGTSQRSALQTLFFWLWRLRYYLLLIYLILFSVLFSMTQFVKYTFGDSDELPIELELDSKPIYRVYDTKSISPLSEMLVKHRFSKLYSKLPKSLTDNLKPFYIRSKIQPNPNDITVSAFVTENRFEDLIRLAELWKGPISATLHIINYENDNKSYLDSMIALKNLFKKNQKITNHDTWPYSSELYTKIKDYYIKYLEKNNIIILPTFVFINNSSSIMSSLDKTSEASMENNSYNSVDHILQFPNNRDELIHLVKDDKMALLDRGWELNNGPTCLDKFMKREDNLPYQLETYDFYYKPNFIVKKNGKIPWCTERFDDNKAACLLQIEYLALNKWKTQISAQVRKECRRVISSLGEGIRKK
ncbi:6429_t:CDS:2, partial [Entrophospora sp. SA101]